MAVRTIHKISAWSLYAMLAVTVVVFALFFGGGYVDPNAEMLEPVYTEPLIYWAYILVGIGVVLTFAFALVQFIGKFKSNTKGAIQSLCVLVAFAILLLVCWSLGDGTPLDILGYEGAENVEFWLKLTDMFLYSVYFLIAAPVVIMFVAPALKLIKK